jgi:hypothetical protein
MIAMTRRAKIKEVYELIAGVHYYPKIWVHCDGVFSYREREYSETQFLQKVNRKDRLIGIGDGLDNCLQDKELLALLKGL